jgi:PAS domain S-box-containing protein
MELVHPKDREWVIARAAKRLAGEPVPARYEFRILRKDGSTRWVEQFASLIQFEGKPAAMTAYVDVTERKTAHEDLRQSEERYRNIIEHTQEVFYSHDVDGVFNFLSPGIDEVFGYTPEEMMRDYREFLTENPANQKAIETAERALATGVKQPAYILEMKHKDGTPIWLEIEESPFKDEAGDVIGIVGAARDITDRKKAEEALQKAFDEIQSLKEQLEAENISLREEIRLHHRHGEILGESEGIRAVLAQIEEVAPTEATVLIAGETGTGKELVARAIHRLGLRKEKPLVTVNCAALPANLIESELFGREKGAYTGALTKMTGRFEIAHGSTLFLDEIGELPLEVQAKLLRILEEGTFERLGSTKTLKADVRFIAATNRNLEEAVKNRRFREDLFYRLNVFPIAVPPLRERPEDIPKLAGAFIQEFAERMGKRIESVSRKSLDKLLTYPWPGNVRELRNLVERSLIRCKGGKLDLETPARLPSATSAATLDNVQRSHILEVLERTGWRIRGEGGAAETLGLKPTTLESRMEKLGIRRNKP